MKIMSKYCSNLEEKKPFFAFQGFTGDAGLQGLLVSLKSERNNAINMPVYKKIRIHAN